MAKYAMLFIGGTVAEDKRQQNMKDWMSWMQDLGDKIVDPGGPFMGEAKVVSANGAKDYNWENDSNVGGYIIVEAESVDGAVAMTKGCPAINPIYGEGNVEVREVMNM